MRATYDLETNEVRLEAGEHEYALLAAAARSGDDRLPCATPPSGPDAPPRPADAPLPLPAVEVRGHPDPEALVSLAVAGPGLVIAGGAEPLALLAREFTQLSHADSGAQLLAEWFPGHAYLASGSVPVVFARVATDAG